MMFPFQQVISLIAAIDASRKAVISEDELAMIPPERRVDKPAAASLIVPRNWETYLDKLSDLPILMGVNKARKWLEVLGGGLQSQEEVAFDAIMAGATFNNLIDPKNNQPSRYGGAFYHLQAVELLTKGQFKALVYNTRGGENDQLAALREVVEEGVVNGIQVVTCFSNTVNVGVLFRPFNLNLRTALESKFPGMYDGSQSFVQVVVQRGFLATVDVEAPTLPHFADNVEISKLNWVTIGELFDLAKVKAGQQANLSQEMQGEVLRNSVPLHFVEWFAKWLIAQGREFSW